MGTYIPNNRILYVDDEPGLLSAFMSLMRKVAVKAHILQDSTQIEKVLVQDGPFAVVFSDQRMPGLDGVGVLETVARVHPSTMRVMVTGYADHGETLRAINIGGICSYITKPWEDDELRRLTEDFVARYNLTGENKHLLGELAASNRSLQELLEGTVSETVRLLGDIVESVNPQAATHASLIRQLGKKSLEMMPEIDAEERWSILRALDLCYLGLAVMPAWIQVSLNKQGLAALERFPVAKNHHLLASDLIKNIPRFSEVAKIIRFLGKDYNGAGEPLDESVSGEMIPFGSRLLHILFELDRRMTEHMRGHESLRRMAEHPEKYDSAIITQILNRPARLAGDESEAAVALDALHPGMIVVDDILTQSHQCLLRAGATLSETSINIIRQWHRKDPIPEKLRVRIPG